MLSFLESKGHCTCRMQFRLEVSLPAVNCQKSVCYLSSFELLVNKLRGNRIVQLLNSSLSLYTISSHVWYDGSHYGHLMHHVFSSALSASHDARYETIVEI